MGALFVVSYSYQNVSAVYQSLWAPDPMNVPPWKSLQWIENHTRPEEKMLSPIAPSLILYAGRESISMINAATREDLMYALMRSHIRYVVERPIVILTPGIEMARDPNRQWSQLQRWIAHDRRHCQLVFEDPTEQVTIYKIREDRVFMKAYEEYKAALIDLRSGDTPAGMIKLQASLARYPQLSSAHNGVGATYFREKKNLLQAKQDLLKAIQIDPDYQIALLNLARVYYRLGNPALSSAYLRKSAAITVSNGEGPAFREILRLGQAAHEFDVPNDLAISWN